jgi:antitoxin component of MazEF toxin-antitoxin module
LSEEESYVQRFKPTKRGGSFYLLVPKEVMKELKISEDDGAELKYDKTGRKISYNFEPLKKR